MGQLKISACDFTHYAAMHTIVIFFFVVMPERFCLSWGEYSINEL
jgi:hypothetical protein